MKTLMQCEDCKNFFEDWKEFENHPCRKNVKETQTKEIAVREATLALIEWYKENASAVSCGKMRKKVLWDKISNKLKGYGYTYTSEQVAGRWKSLLRAYKNIRDHNNKSGNSAKSYEFEKELDEIFAADPAVTPKFTLETKPSTSSEVTPCSSKTNQFTETSGIEKCVICLDKPPNCVYADCGHLVTCMECASRILDCPVCREAIIQKIKVFK
ncbi:hypothetical protein KUTeg_022138 [Tegillarca granosa]|uniref:RING-type domain-containing protein n=1 Tax=Tegillarca granosa TaxID=220873 RepID=A0ABQ9E5D4_TEGGR|nr:hypothetical protein KUTeg_022138 [Tegillarca granosa]